MSCTPDEVACQIERIADRMSVFDLNGFLATLIATVIGAAVASVITVLLYRHELRERRRVTIDDAIVLLIKEIQDFTNRLRAWRAESAKYERRMQRLGKKLAVDELPTVPDRSAMQTAAEAFVLVSGKPEQTIAENTRRLLVGLSKVSYLRREPTEYNDVRQILVAWRSGKRSTDEALGGLNSVDGNRAIIMGGHEPESYHRVPDPFGDWRPRS